MVTDNDQTPASAVLMLEGLAWALERLPAPSDPYDGQARAYTVKAVRDAARAAVDQHHEWSAAQLAAARDSSNGAWHRELLGALLGAEDAHLVMRRNPPTPPADRPTE